MLLDPVCGMTVDDSALRVEGYDDFAFCAPGCRTAFVANPDDYAEVVARTRVIATEAPGGRRLHVDHPVGQEADTACCGRCHDKI